MFPHSWGGSWLRPSLDLKFYVSHHRASFFSYLTCYLSGVGHTLSTFSFSCQQLNEKGAQYNWSPFTRISGFKSEEPALNHSASKWESQDYAQT